MKKKEKEIPKFINTMFDNWETLYIKWVEISKDFDYTMTKDETINCLGKN